VGSRVDIACFRARSKADTLPLATHPHLLSFRTDMRNLPCIGLPRCRHENSRAVTPMRCVGAHWRRSPVGGGGVASARPNGGAILRQLICASQLFGGERVDETSEALVRWWRAGSHAARAGCRASDWGCYTVMPG